MPSRSPLSETVDPNPEGQSGHLALTTSYAYDEAGRRVAETNPRGHATAYQYDAANRLTTVTDARSGTVAIAYDAAGQTLSVTNPRGKSTAFTYDPLGNVLTATDPLGRVQEHAYDPAGRETSVTDARGVAVAYAYDDANRLTAVDYAAVGGLPAGQVTHGWDAANRRTGVSDTAGGAAGWTYDAAGRVTQASSPQGTIGYAYDSRDLRTGMTLPGGRTVAYAYDDAGHLTSLTDWQARTTTYAYDPDGRVAEVERPNDVRSAYGYDAAGRLAGISHYDPADQPLAEYGYVLDANGNRTQVAITGSAVATGTETFNYDELDRLTTATYPGGGSATYAYDANGNRTAVVSGGQTADYAHDDADQLTGIDGPGGLVALTYDPNGNRTADGAGTYAYDWTNRLAAATVGGTSVAYGYSGDGLRTSRSENGGPAQALLWDRAAGLPELVDDGAASYLHGPDGEVAEVAPAGQATYALADGLGTARARTDGAGAVVATADHDAWGNVRNASGTQGAHGWAGERADPATGLAYLRARDYAPGSGRLLQRDPVSPSVGGTQGYNPYPYAANNPTTLADPTGRSPLEAIQGAIEAMKRLVGKLRDLSAVYMRMPPIIRPLVGALLGFATIVVRLLVFAIVGWVIEQVVGWASKTLVGGGLVLLGWVRMFVAGAKTGMHVCAKIGRWGHLWMCRRAGLASRRRVDRTPKSWKFTTKTDGETIRVRGGQADDAE